MAWRAANSLLRLQDAVNAKYPKNRSKALDAFIGDAAHAARKSDHNPNANGAVCAYDITHDLAHGVDVHALADYMAAHPDQRVSYIISNGRIWNLSISPAWRRYSGSNPHNKHIHVSVHQDSALYDLNTPWDLGPPVAQPTVPLQRPDVLRRGSLGEDVEVLQWLVGSPVDGDFGPNTLEAVRAFQATYGLVADGIVGQATWDKIRSLTLPSILTPAEPVEPETWENSGRGSWYSQHRGLYSWVDTGDRPNSNALGVPDDQQGIALYSRPTLGKWFTVKAPNGTTLRLQQTDIGPHPNTGRKIDIAAVAAERFGYSPSNFPTDSIFMWSDA